MQSPVLRLVHVAIPAPDIDSSARFYSLLGARPGFTRRDASGQAVLMQLHFADTFVELLRDAPPQGGGHVAFTTGDIDLVWQLLAGNGHRPSAPPARGESGVMWFFVNDPAGNLVEITMVATAP